MISIKQRQIVKMAVALLAAAVERNEQISLGLLLDAYKVGGFGGGDNPLAGLTAADLKELIAEIDREPADPVQDMERVLDVLKRYLSQPLTVAQITGVLERENTPVPSEHVGRALSKLATLGKAKWCNEGEWYTDEGRTPQNNPWKKAQEQVMAVLKANKIRPMSSFEIADYLALAGIEMSVDHVITSLQFLFDARRVNVKDRKWWYTGEE